MHKDPVLEIHVKNGGITCMENRGALVCTCRQVKDEALAVFFKDNSFKFYWPRSHPRSRTEGYKGWFGRLGKHIQELNSIQTEAWNGHYFRMDMKTGTGNYDLKLVDSDSTPATPYLTVTRKFMPAIRHFLDKIIMKADEQGVTPAIDESTLIKLLDLVYNGRRDIYSLRWP